ncbi:hypothetical protein GZ989_011320 (plasmid) [Campylobacter fetus]|uniref:Conjugal transfer protein TrbM n=1 Tax=Campylobacter fetus TaxID=196 RepID=A0A974MRE5_CAMFE|nr:TrbM/KikA/MpfK family conjugal transfer protein [Campylobacter fetus]OCS32894.1 hypothetical protein AWR31_08115 [Campylobacter fetus subsp. venerealis]QMS59896.1 hypothetical protein GZ989_011320 [Campylobacter fetus]
MKKVLSSLVLSTALVSSVAFANEQQNVFAPDVLTGDVKLACEAILCLSSSTRPGECAPSLHRYFSISAKKWKDTVKKRRNFLKLCPVGDSANNDKTFTDLRDNVIATLDNPCDLNALNSNLEYDELDFDTSYYFRGVRVSPKLPRSCEILSKNVYTNIKPKYKCSGEFYSRIDWDRGYTIQNGNKVAIKKDCWSFE